jgi:hypothetical protein
VNRTAHLTSCTSLRAVVELIQAPRTVRYVTRSRSEKRASYHSRSTRSWNVRTCIMSPDPLVHMHAHSAGTWQPTPAPTSMGNAAGRCALVHSTRLGAGANGPDSNPLLLDGWQGDKSDISCKLCFVAATSLSGDPSESSDSQTRGGGNTPPEDFRVKACPTLQPRWCLGSPRDGPNT